jgi:hypothetical protein
LTSDFSNSDEELLTFSVELLSLKESNRSRSMLDSSKSAMSTSVSRSSINDEMVLGWETSVFGSKSKMTLAISEMLATSPNSAWKIKTRITILKRYD